ncbi:class I SAM-dependent methyltransferase [Bradyrhizobium sp. LjRoot220]|uniref:methyltransferase domain-containing protein n=1 Tax=Bradyrhizobium sp. LjRoot220 TaxID=3342284 RepID=UPI003ECEEE18
MTKNLLREVTPPIVWRAARYVRRATQQPAPTEELPAPAPAPAKPLPEAPKLEYRHALALAARIPELQSFGLSITPENAAAILDFYNGYLPLIRQESRGAHLRTLAARLRKSLPDQSDRIDVIIARANLADGVADRAQRLKSDPDSVVELVRQTEAYERAYGAKIVTEKWGSAPSRGASLLYYFENHPSLVTGKDVLHIAPEPETRAWLPTVCRYVVLDGVPDEASDVAADVTQIPLPDGSFDTILCHRVLEHILDDIAAMKEFHRILRPGGILNMSVPQAVHRPQTAEWMVFDESHDWHVRQYGADLPDRLESVGFAVRPVLWLCEQAREDLLARNALPMRMYEAAKR